MNGYLICIGGLPGVGKTVIAHRLQGKLSNSVVLDPDKIRLSIVGKSPETDRLLDEDITNESTDATIEMMKAEAIEALTQGKIVIIGSAFTGKSMREEYEAVAEEKNVIFKAVWLEAKNEIRQQRAEKRLSEEGNPSAVSANFDLKIEGGLHWPVIDADRSIDEVYANTIEVLKI